MKRLNTRDHIIKTASDLFYKQGYNLTGINEIIEKAGIAKATLYAHFKSKDDLCIAYINDRDQSLLEDLEAFCAQKPKGKKQVIAVLEFLQNFFNSKGFNGCWCLRTISELPQDNKLIRQTIQANKQHFLKFIESLIASNLEGVSKAKSKRLAQSTYLLYEGAVTESYLQKEEWPITNAIDVLKTLLKGL